MGKGNKVVHIIKGTSVSGSLSFMGSDNAFSDGTIDVAGKVSFKGDLKTISYHQKGFQ